MLTRLHDKAYVSFEALRGRRSIECDGALPFHVPAHGGNSIRNTCIHPSHEHLYTCSHNAKPPHMPAAHHTACRGLEASESTNVPQEDVWGHLIPAAPQASTLQCRLLHIGILFAMEKRTHDWARSPMMESSEVLPLPLGPIKASTSPGLQHPVMSNRICTKQRHIVVNKQTIRSQSTHLKNKFQSINRPSLHWSKRSVLCPMYHA